MSKNSQPSPPSSAPDAAAPCDGAVQPCPLADKIKLVELVEVVEHGGKQTTQAATGRKQYINLDNTIDTDAPHPEYGRCIRLKARVEWQGGDASRSLAGKTVYWSNTPDGGNKAGLTGTETEGFGSAGGGKTTTSSTDAAGWTPVVEFHLSIYGGDKFEVRATEAADGTGGLKTGTYVVWRKLWYEIDTMKSRDGGLLTMDHAGLPALYSPAYIELAQQGTDNEPDNTWNIQTSDLHTFANAYFGAAKSPFQSHEVGIDHQADKQNASLTIAMTAATYTHGSTDSFYVYEGGDTWLTKAEYDDGSGAKTLAKSKVTLTGANKVYKAIQVDLSAGPVTPTAAKPVSVTLEYVKSKEWSGDGASKPHAIVAMGYWYDTETATEAKKRTQGTMAHELGHLLGMVPTSSSTHVDTGTGHHCTDIACVMYSTNTTTRGNNFCGVCIETLRRADLSTVKTSFTHTKGAKA